MSTPKATDALRERLAALSPEQRAALEARMLATGTGAPSPSPDVGENPRFPLTDVQQAYWAGRGPDFELGGVSTHSYAEIETRGIDLPRLEAAWNRLVARHEMLRAVIHDDGTQEILADVPHYAIALTDLSNRSEAEAEAHCGSVREDMSHQLFALHQWPVFEIRATRFDESHVRLHLSFDAIVADLSSRAVLMREWALLYQDPGCDLPPLPGSFQRFVLEERAAQSSERYAQARDYWMARIDTLPETPALPLGDQQALGAPPRFTRRSVRIDGSGWRRLEQFARDIGVSASCLMLAVYADVLRLWSADDGFTLNLTLFNRPADGSMSGVVGDFTSLTLLEVEGSDGSFESRARALQSQLWRDLEHRAFNGVQVSRALARRRERAGAALMPVVFTSALDLTAGNPQEWPGEEGFSVSQTPQVWIDLIVTRSGDGIACHWNTVDALFPPGMIDAMVAAFERLLGDLGTLALGPDASWSTIAAALLPPSDRELQGAANATSGTLPSRLLHEPWRDHLSSSRIAVIASDASLTYADLAERMAQMAEHLRAAGAGPGSIVAVALTKGCARVAAPLAILETGAAYLPLDPAWPAVRIGEALADAGATLVVTESTVDASIAWPTGIRRIQADCLAPVTPHASPRAELDPTSLAYVIYTSGSSGKPKGVAIDHRGAANTIDDINARFAVGPGDRVLALSALSFDLSVYDIFGVLGAGGTIVLPDPDRALDPAHWASLIDAHGVTLWNSVPAFMELLVEYAAIHGKQFPSLRNILLSGDRIPTDLPRAIHAIAPHAATTSLGGATEASIWSIAYPIDPRDRFETSIPYGKPLCNQRFRVVGPGGVDRPVWVPGDLLIEGAGLALGYFNNPAATEAGFSGEGDERFYRTGDRGRYLPDGNIEFLGRDDDQIKLRGFRIELGEIEAALLSHPEVRAAAATVSGTGTSGRKLVAHVVPNGEAISSATLTEHLRTRLPAYMIPAAIEPIAALPLTPNGKIDRRKLRAPSAVAESSSAAVTDSALLARISELVREIAGIDAPADASLLDQGMTSVEVIRLVNAIEGAFGVRPDIREFYSTPTMDWLAAACAAGVAPESDDPPTSEPFRRDQPGNRRLHNPPSPISLDGDVPEPLAAMLAGRRSVRRFTLRPVPSASLAGLLAALRPTENGWPYGSAGDCYAVQTYLFARPGRITDLAGGGYYYDPVEHSLQLLGACPHLRPEAFAPQNAQIFAEAGFAVVLAADMRAIEARYGDRSSRFAAIEAGLMTQLLELAAPTLRLGLCQLGGVDTAAAASAFELGPDHRVLHVLAGGEPDGNASEGASLLDEHARLLRMIERVERLSEGEAQSLLDGERGDG